MPSTCGQREDGKTLREMLLGPPLSAPRPSVQETDAALTQHVQGIPAVMANTYGTASEATREAGNEVAGVAAMSASEQGICCKRALLLFALRREPELKRHFERAEPGLTKDLVERVLPFIDPAFLKHSCQAPESYVFMAVLLSEMFGEEKLGNWPRARTTTEPDGC